MALISRDPITNARLNFYTIGKYDAPHFKMNRKYTVWVCLCLHKVTKKLNEFFSFAYTHHLYLHKAHL